MNISIYNTCVGNGTLTAEHDFIVDWFERKQNVWHFFIVHNKIIKWHRVFYRSIYKGLSKTLHSKNQ